MSTLLSAPHWCILLGIITLCQGLACILIPTHLARVLKAAPRNQIAGCILSAIAWAWAAFAVKEMGLDFMMPYMKYLPFLTIGLIALTWIFLKELLTSRAIAGILMLFPMPLILSMRADPSAFRLIPITFSYIMAVLGMDIMLYPWHHRNALFWLAADTRRLRCVAPVFLTLSALFFVTATQISA